MDTQARVQDLLKIWSTMQNARTHYEQQWKDIVKWISPERNFWDGSGVDKPGFPAIYDGTPVSALTILANGLQGYIANKNSRSFKVAMESSSMLREKPYAGRLRRYMQELDELFYWMIDLRLVDNCAHLIDITGVGQAVWDMMVRQGLAPIGISITNGLQTNSAGYGYTVPKVELISSLQLALRNRHLKFADGLDQEIVNQIRHEFSTFVPKPRENRSVSYEAWREKDHDDIILALAMNVWWVYRQHGVQIVRKRRFGTPNDYDPLRFGL